MAGLAPCVAALLPSVSERGECDPQVKVLWVVTWLKECCISAIHLPFLPFSQRNSTQAHGVFMFLSAPMVCPYTDDYLPGMHTARMQEEALSVFSGPRLNVHHADLSCDLWLTCVGAQLCSRVMSVILFHLNCSYVPITGPLSMS